MKLGGEFGNTSAGVPNTSSGGRSILSYFCVLPLCVIVGVLVSFLMNEKFGVGMPGIAMLLVGTVLGAAWFFSPFAKESPLAHFFVTLVLGGVAQALYAHL